MASLSALPSTARVLAVGYPGAGKTGMLAALANAGFKLRILDFDGNYEPLQQFIKPEALANVDIQSLEDKMVNSPDGRYMEPDGIPTAFNNAVKLMKHWKWKEGDQEFDLGKPADWGPDHVVVLDGITGLGQAAKNRAMKMMNKTPLNMTQQVWGTAMQDQERFVQLLTSRKNGFNVVALSHLKMVGPKDIVKDDDDLTKDLKERVAELVQTRLYPSALGQALPPMIAGEFGTVLLVEAKVKRDGSVQRVIQTQPRAELDLKLPANLPADPLPITDGLLTIFRSLGVNPPA